MKKVFISLAVLIVSAFAVVAVISNNKLDRHLAANVEALAGSEGLVGNCKDDSNKCMYSCSCGAVWEAQTTLKGPSYNVSGTCSAFSNIVK